MLAANRVAYQCAAAHLHRHDRRVEGDRNQFMQVRILLRILDLLPSLMQLGSVYKPSARAEHNHL